MRNSVPLFLILLLSFAVCAQRTNIKNPSTTKPTQTNKSGGEKEEFDKAAALANPLERIAALQNFIKNFSKSAQIVRAQELIVSARAQIGDEKLRADDAAGGIAFFKAAITDAPVPISDKLFSDVILQLPTNLFFRGERVAAVEIAKIIEEKIGANAKQILGLATFYLGTENAYEGRRLAKKAIELDANLPSAYQTLGLASRMNFQLEDAVNAYAKALELDNKSTVSRRSLADVKRATGKADEAAALYREILAVDAEDGAAQTGLILALFDAGKKQEAETMMAKSLEANPNNLFLLVGAAYWYAANNNGEKAVELAQQALVVEPRYTWAHIALARGFLAQKLPLEAERALLTAKQYGDFPTLDYEIATARLEAGFYREAAQILRRSFLIKDDYVRARLGGRVLLEAQTFSELLGAERRASIFQPLAADSAENAERLKILLDLAQKLDSADATETEIIAAADKFISGEDVMKFHRQMFIAKQLLQSKKALPKILEIIQSAIPKVDSALNVPNAAAAILADALYESRNLAIQRNQIIVVPSLPRQTLSNILRGEMEEITGWTLFQQNKTGEAIIRLKRALSILPEKSAWWLTSQWQLGTALEADGKSAEALDAYIKSYTNGTPDLAKYTIIKTLYQKINGNAEDLEQKIGAKPTPVNPAETTVAQTNPVVSPTPATEATPTVSPTPTVEITTEKETTTQPAENAETKPTDEVSQTKSAETKIEPTPSPTTEVKTETTVQITPTETKPVQKPLFEPIIITIPKNETKPSKESKTEESKSSETKSETTEKPAEQSVGSGEVRVRKVTAKAEEIPPCTIVASQENVSILNGGGTLGVLVGFEKDGDLKQIKAVSSSPNDVEVMFDPEVGENSGRAFFVIKSISGKTGIFTISFEAPCGKKEVSVKVR